MQKRAERQKMFAERAARREKRELAKAQAAAKAAIKSVTAQATFLYLINATLC